MKDSWRLSRHSTLFSNEEDNMTVIPAYGRDYKNTAEVTLAWNLGKDFMIQDCSSKDNGRYINRTDWQNHCPDTEVWVRIKGLRSKVRVA